MLFTISFDRKMCVAKLPPRNGWFPPLSLSRAKARQYLLCQTGTKILHWSCYSGHVRICSWDNEGNRNSDHQTGTKKGTCSTSYILVSHDSIAGANHCGPHLPCIYCTVNASGHGYTWCSPVLNLCWTESSGTLWQLVGVTVTWVYIGKQARVNIVKHS